jgi:integral membrane protein
MKVHVCKVLAPDERRARPKHRRETAAPAIVRVVSPAMNALRQLRLVAWVEGLSFVLLLFVAMPLKYMAGMPLAVRIAGSVHGILFLLFIAALYRVASEREWPIRRSAVAFLSSIVPFGTFVFDASLKREISSATRKGS